MKKRRQRHGTVLIIVVVLVMLLSLIAYKYLLAMQTEHLVTVVHGDRLQAKQSAESACDLLKMMLSKSRAQRDELGGLTDNPAFFAGNIDALQGTNQTSVLTATDQPPFGLIAYSLVRETEQSGVSPAESNEDSNTAAAGTRTRQSVPFYPPTRYGAVNESQKLHLWKLIEWEAASPGAGVASLLSLPGMDQGTAEALMDWLDRDDEPREQGAESEFYATLTRPMAPRNGLPVELDELLFVKGVTTLRLYGTLSESRSTTDPSSVNSSLGTNLNTNYEQDTGAALDGQYTLGDAAPPRPWIDLLTIYSAERNESYTGQPRIFVNGKDLSELHQQLASRISREWADFVVLYRQLGPSEAVATENNNPTETSSKIDFDVPATTVIESLVDLIGTSVAVPAEDENEDATIVPSPAQTESMASTDLEMVFDQLTLTPRRRMIGRMNINEAPPELLATLPALDRETVQRIFRAREGANDRDRPHVHPIWLLANDLVDSVTMRALLPDVTCGGDVFRAQVWGRAQADAPMFRFETVLDATKERCRPVYYRELDASNHTIKILSAQEFASLGLGSRSGPGSGGEGFEGMGNTSESGY